MKKKVMSTLSPLGTMKGRLDKATKSTAESRHPYVHSSGKKKQSEPD